MFQVIWLIQIYLPLMKGILIVVRFFAVVLEILQTLVESQDNDSM
jgi:hypothetical protein